MPRFEQTFDLTFRRAEGDLIEVKHGYTSLMYISRRSEDDLREWLNARNDNLNSTCLTLIIPATKHP